MFASFTNFLADVKMTVNAVLEDEKKEYEAEQARLNAQKERQIEQQKQRERQAVPLWTIWKEEKKQIETELQQKILKLSNDRRTFLSPAPDSSVFKFDMNVASPFATYALKIDLALERARYLLVPRKLEEEVFWRNYFYRVENLREMMKVDSIFNISEEEAAKRQAAMTAAIASAAALAKPAQKSGGASSSSVVPGSGHTVRAVANDDDDDFNHDELNQYLNEELSDEENEEPKVEPTPPPAASPVTPPTTTSPATSSTVPAAAAPAVATSALAPSTTAKPASTSGAAAPATKPVAASVVASNAVKPTPAPTIAASTAAPTPAKPIAAPSPAPKPAPTVTPTVVAPPKIPSELVDNDDADLAELESMLQEVGASSNTITSKPSTQPASKTSTIISDEDLLDELEKELDM